jgi:hypothetical protein
MDKIKEFKTDRIDIMIQPSKKERWVRCAKILNCTLTELIERATDFYAQAELDD